LRLPAHRKCDTRIHTANREPLGAIYNEALEQLHPESLVVFCHDDVWLGEACLRRPLLEALERFDLVAAAQWPHLGPSPSAGRDPPWRSRRQRANPLRGQPGASHSACRQGAL
jgi:hypothetical protein